MKVTWLRKSLPPKGYSQPPGVFPDVRSVKLPNFNTNLTSYHDSLHTTKSRAPQNSFTNSRWKTTSNYRTYTKAWGFFWWHNNCCGIREKRRFVNALEIPFFGKRGEFSFWRKSCSTWWRCNPILFPLATLTITSNVPYCQNQFSHQPSFATSIWGFPKMVVPNNHGFSY